MKLLRKSNLFKNFKDGLIYMGIDSTFKLTVKTIIKAGENILFLYSSMKVKVSQLSMLIERLTVFI